MKRGDVVIVDFPFVSGAHGKTRPAVIIQNDRDNGRLANTIIAMISGNLRRADESTQVLIDTNTSDGKVSGLHKPSIANCTVLYTIGQRNITKVIGYLSNSLVEKINQCLRASMEIP